MHSVARDSARTIQFFGKSFSEISTTTPGLSSGSSGAAVLSNRWIFSVWAVDVGAAPAGFPPKFLVLNKPKFGAEQSGFVVADALTYTDAKGSDLFVHECFSQSRNNRVAVLAKVKNGKFVSALQAWKADTVRGTFAHVNPKTVKCEFEEETAE